MFTDEDAKVALQRYQRLIQGFCLLDKSPVTTYEGDPDYKVDLDGITLGMGYHVTTGSFWLELHPEGQEKELYTFWFHNSWEWGDGVPPCPQEKLLEEVMEFIADYT